ncbi:MAG: hypothetical protein ACRYG4_17875 [Janthinobacterium lividum]
MQIERVEDPGRNLADFAAWRPVATDLGHGALDDVVRGRCEQIALVGNMPVNRPAPCCEPSCQDTEGQGLLPDFARLSYLSFTGEGGHIVALIEIGVPGTDQSIIISEHWDIANDRAVRLRVAYFDPKALLDQIAAQASTGAPIDRPAAKEPD